MAAKITLSNDQLSIDRTADDPDVEVDGSYNRCTVDKGEWIVYKSRDYSPTTPTPNESKVVSEDDGLVHLQFDVGSTRIVNTFKLEGMTLYQHSNFGGQEKALYDSNPNVYTGGVSSVIIGGGRWELFTQPDYKGGHAIKGPGIYPNPEAMGFPNDMLYSVRKLD